MRAWIWPTSRRTTAVSIQSRQLLTSRPTTKLSCSCSSRDMTSSSVGRRHASTSFCLIEWLSPLSIPTSVFTSKTPRLRLNWKPKIMKQLKNVNNWFKIKKHRSKSAWRAASRERNISKNCKMLLIQQSSITRIVRKRPKTSWETKRRNWKMLAWLSRRSRMKSTRSRVKFPSKSRTS